MCSGISAGRSWRLHPRGRQEGYWRIPRNARNRADEVPMRWHDYSIDLDLVKRILRCHKVEDVQWRISSSGKGFHFWWRCKKRTCKACESVEKQYDDQKRFRHDKRRPKAHRRILWDIKAGRKASPWKKIGRQ